MNKFMKINKNLLIVLAVLTFALTSGLLVYGLTSFDKDESKKENYFTVGVLKGELGDEQFTKDQPVQPGESNSQKKIVVVENTGNLNLFVRVMVFPEIISEQGILLQATIGEEGSDSEIIMDKLGSDWLYGGDGYYYYTKKLAKGAVTDTPLFSSVYLVEGLSTDYDGASLTIQVKSETVTSVGLQYRDTWWGGEPTAADPLLQAVDEKLKVSGIADPIDN